MFLVANQRLYNSLCLSVCPYVCPSRRPSQLTKMRAETTIHDLWSCIRPCSLLPHRTTTPLSRTLPLFTFFLFYFFFLSHFLRYSFHYFQYLNGQREDPLGRGRMGNCSGPRAQGGPALLKIKETSSFKQRCVQKNFVLKNGLEIVF